MRENLSTRFANPPQYNNIDFIHLSSNSAQTMYPIIGNVYLNEYLIKSHVPNGPRKSDKTFT